MCLGFLLSSFLWFYTCTSISLQILCTICWQLWIRIRNQKLVDFGVWFVDCSPELPSLNFTGEHTFHPLLWTWNPRYWFQFWFMRAMQQKGNGRLLEPIHGLISPDLPTKVSLLDFFCSLLSSNMFSSTEDKERQPVVDMHTVLKSGIQGFKCWQVRTVAAQTRTMAQIQELMVKRAEQIDNSGCGGALLLVSGGTIPNPFSWSSSQYMLNPCSSHPVLNFVIYSHWTEGCTPGRWKWWKMFASCDGTQREVDFCNSWITFMYCTGHPLREHWLTGKLTPADSFSMFRAAKLLQDSGLLPPGNQICPDFSYLITNIWTLEVEKD